MQLVYVFANLEKNKSLLWHNNADTTFIFSLIFIDKSKRSECLVIKSPGINTSKTK